MKKIFNNLKVSFIVLLSGMFFLTSCNKDLENPGDITVPAYPTGNGVAATLAANPNYSFYSALITRAGMTATLNDLTKTFTLFATDNTGMKIAINSLSGGAVPLNAPDATFLGFISSSLPAASAAGIVQYNTLGQKLAAASIPTTFPNYPYTSQIILDPNQPFVRMNIFPVRGTPYSYVNNLPLTGVDLQAGNGVIHTAYTVPAPPTAVLKSVIAADTLAYFRAAIARADSGSTGLNRFDSLMNYGVTNMTILAPNDGAFKTLVYGLVYAKVFALTGSATTANTQANLAVAAGPPFLSTNNVTTADIRGIVAYHIIANNSGGASYVPGPRVFSVNVPSTSTFLKTLVNSSLAVHPGVMAQATYSGPAVTSLKFTGYGTFPPGGAPFSGAAANVVSFDKLAVNGVYHVIDKVLLPQ